MTRTALRSALAATCVVVAAACASSASGSKPGQGSTSGSRPAGTLPVTTLSHRGPVGVTGPLVATSLADLLRETAAAQHLATASCSPESCWSNVHLSEPTLLIAVIPVNAGCLDTRDVSARLADPRTLRIIVTVAQCQVGLGPGGTQAQPAQVLYGIAMSGLPHRSHLDVAVEVAGIPGKGATPEEVGTAGVDVP